MRARRICVCVVASTQPIPPPHSSLRPGARRLHDLCALFSAEVHSCLPHLLISVVPLTRSLPLPPAPPRTSALPLPPPLGEGVAGAEQPSQSSFGLPFSPHPRQGCVCASARWPCTNCTRLHPIQTPLEYARSPPPTPPFLSSSTPKRRRFFLPPSPSLYLRLALVSALAVAVHLAFCFLCACVRVCVRGWGGWLHVADHHEGAAACHRRGEWHS